jgi:hypothetical protein
MAGERPGVARWVWYAFGRRLPARYAQWVLHDLTCRTWFVRHMLRSLTQCLPALVLLVLPASPSLMVMMLGIVVFGALFYAMAFAWESRDHRLYQHGFVPELVLPRDGEDTGRPGHEPDDDQD